MHKLKLEEKLERKPGRKLEIPKITKQGQVRADLVNQKRRTVLAVFNVSCHARRRRAAFSVKFMNFLYFSQSQHVVFEDINVSAVCINEI